MTLRRAHHVDLGGCRNENLKLFAQSLGSSREHGVASAEYYVSVEVLSHVEIAFHDRLVDHFMEGRHLEVEFSGGEESFSTSESLIAEGDDLTIGKGVCAVVPVGLLVVYMNGSLPLSSFS